MDGIVEIVACRQQGASKEEPNSLIHFSLACMAWMRQPGWLRHLSRNSVPDPLTRDVLPPVIVYRGVRCHVFNITGEGAARMAASAVATCSITGGAASRSAAGSRSTYPVTGAGAE